MLREQSTRPSLQWRAVLAPGTDVSGRIQGLVAGNQVVLAIAYQVGSTHGLQGFAKQWPVVGVVVSQKCLVQTPALVAAHNINCFRVTPYFSQRIFSRVVHGRGRSHWAWVKGLHLVCPETIGLQPNGQVHHVFVACAGVGGNEVGNEVLFFTGISAELVEHLFETVVSSNARLHHFGQRIAFGVLRRNF